jgi:putative oxidoreductase
VGVLFGESVRGAAGYAPLVVRVLVGIIMFAHGLQKLQGGPENFSQVLAQLGVPFPELMGYVVAFVELVGGILLIVGLLSRLAALLLTIDLVVAILLVKVNIGLLSPADGSGVGAELDLALIAGFLVVLLAGPGKLSADHALGYEGDLVQEQPARRRRRRRRRGRMF